MMHTLCALIDAFQRAASRCIQCLLFEGISARGWISWKVMFNWTFATPTELLTTGVVCHNQWGVGMVDSITVLSDCKLYIYRFLLLFYWWNHGQVLSPRTDISTSHSETIDFKTTNAIEVCRLSMTLTFAHFCNHPSYLFIHLLTLVLSHFSFHLHIFFQWRWTN